MVLEVIQREIPLRSIGYLVLRDCPEDRLGEALGRGMERLKKAGAKTVWATSLPEGEPLHSGPIGVWRLTHVYDTLRMECPLNGRERPAEKLTLRPLKRSADDKAYVELINRSCADIPTAQTVTAGELRQQGRRHGLVYRGEDLIGCYRLELGEKVPEISALAVAPEFRGQGLGRLLLQNLLSSLRTPTCALTVPSRSTEAIRLFESEGFIQTGILTSWFEVV